MGWDFCNKYSVVVEHVQNNQHMSVLCVQKEVFAF